MKKYGYPVIIAILVIITLASLYVAGTNYNEIKNIKSKYVDLDKKYSKLKKEDAEKDSKIKKADAESKTKDSQIKALKDKITNSTTNSVENQSVTADSSDVSNSNSQTTNSTGTESDISGINAFAESKAKESEEAKKPTASTTQQSSSSPAESEPEYAVFNGSIIEFLNKYHIGVEQLAKLNGSDDYTGYVPEKGQTVRVR